VTGLINEGRVEGAGPPQAPDVAQGALLVDEAPKGGVDRPLDGPGLGDGASPLEEVVVNVD
jgi:hypothetical protein